LIPNLYIETIRRLHCFLNGLFVVNALRNLGITENKSAAIKGVNAVSRHDEKPAR